MRHLEKYLLGFILGIGLLASTASAAPTSTTVQNLFITGLTSSGNPCLVMTNTGLVVTSTSCGTGGSGSGTVSSIVQGIGGITITPNPLTTTGTISFTNPGFLTNSSITAALPITWSGGSIIGFTNPGFVTAASATSWTAFQQFFAAASSSEFRSPSGTIGLLRDLQGNKYVTSTGILSGVATTSINGFVGTWFNLLGGEGVTTTISNGSTTFRLAINGGTVQTCGAGSHFSSITSSGIATCTSDSGGSAAGTLTTSSPVTVQYFPYFTAYNALNGTSSIYQSSTNGYIGIGTTNPQKPLQVGTGDLFAGTGYGIGIQSNGAGGLYITDNSNDSRYENEIANGAGHVGMTTNHSLEFIVGNQTWFVIRPGGGIEMLSSTVKIGTLQDSQGNKYVTSTSAGGGGGVTTSSALGVSQLVIGSATSTIYSSSLFTAVSSTGQLSAPSGSFSGLLSVTGTSTLGVVSFSSASGTNLSASGFLQAAAIQDTGVTNSFVWAGSAGGFVATGTPVTSLFGLTGPISITTSTFANTFNVTSTSGKLNIVIPNNLSFFTNDAGFKTSIVATNTLIAGGTATGPAITFTTSGPALVGISCSGSSCAFAQSTSSIGLGSAASKNALDFLATTTSFSAGAIPVVSSSLALTDSGLSISAGTISYNGVPIVNGGGIWLSSILQSSASQFIIQASTSPAVLGSMSQGGGTTNFSATQTIATSTFCATGLGIAINTTSAITLTLPTVANINSSTCAGEIGRFAQQYFWNNSTNSVTFAAGAGGTIYYTPGTPATMTPGKVWYESGQYLTSTTMAFYFTEYSTSSDARFGSSTFTGVLTALNISSTNMNVSGDLLFRGVAVSTSTGANPTASVGLNATNGTANTFMRSDAAPALSMTITPVWTGLHQFSVAGISSTQAWIASATIPFLRDSQGNFYSTSTGGSIKINGFSGSIFDLLGGTGTGVTTTVSNGSTTIKVALNNGLTQTCGGSDKVSSISPTGTIVCTTDSTGAGAPGTVVTSSAVTANYFPFWGNSTNGLNGTSSLYQFFDGFSNGVALGTTTPKGLFGVLNASNTYALLAGSSTIPDFPLTVQNAASNNMFTISSSGAAFASTSLTIGRDLFPTMEFTVLGDSMFSGKINVTGTLDTVSKCGNAPSIIGSNGVGIVTTGSNASSTCTITFGTAFTNKPSCRINTETTAQALSTSTIITPSAATLVISQSSSTQFKAAVFDYSCFGIGG